MFKSAFKMQCHTHKNTPPHCFFFNFAARERTTFVIASRQEIAETNYSIINSQTTKN